MYTKAQSLMCPVFTLLAANSVAKIQWKII